MTKILKYRCNVCNKINKFMMMVTKEYKIIFLIMTCLRIVDRKHLKINKFIISSNTSDKHENQISRNVSFGME